MKDKKQELIIENGVFWAYCLIMLGMVAGHSTLIGAGLVLFVMSFTTGLVIELIEMLNEYVVSISKPAKTKR